MDKEKVLEEKILDLEKKLRKSNEDLHECRKASEIFIHIASHDLQAPLRKLSTFVERLTAKSPDLSGKEAPAYMEKIEKTTATMRSLIDSLSQLAEISVADIEYVECDLNEVMNSVIKDLAFLIKENKAIIHLQGLPVIEASAAQLKTVFRNLIQNSIKFRKEAFLPEIAITCELLPAQEKEVHRLPTDGIYYKIEFADNGIGFKEEYVSKIMEPFQRLHGGSAYRGSGLGLAICKKIIDRHLGIMYATGKENSGARFIVILPSTHS